MLKKSICLLLAVVIIISIVAVGSVSVSAVSNPYLGQYLYLDLGYYSNTNYNWYIWTWTNENDGRCVSPLRKEDSQYVFALSDINYNFLFCAMPSGYSSIVWDTKIGQTEDLVLTGNKYTVKRIDNTVTVECDFIYGSCGQCSALFDESEGLLTISGSGTMGNYGAYKNDYEIPAPWSDIRSKIKKVVITSGVTDIGSYAFYQCWNLESVTIPNDVTRIGEYAFGSCAALESVSLPDDLKTIESSAFSNCTGLSSVTIPKDVTSIGRYAFNGCSVLESVSLPAGLKTIESGAFSFCKKIESITLPDGLVSIGNDAFSNCTSLLSITIPKSVTSVTGGAFEYCSSLTDIYVDSENEKFISFNGNLYSSDFTKFVRYAPGKEDKSFSIPRSVKSIGANAFYGSENIESIVVPGNVQSIDASSLSSCKNLSNISIAEGVTDIGSQAFSYNKALKSIVLPESVTEIGSYTFSSCSNLENVTLPKTLTKISQNMFNNCESLKSIELPDSVTEIESYAFYNCKNLENLTIPGKVTAIKSSVFNNCSSLKSIMIPKSVVTIEGYNFRYCSNLEKVFYAGDSTDWNNIDIKENDNDYLFSAKHVNFRDGFGREGADTAHFGDAIPSTFRNIEIMGVQKKADGSKSIRYVAVVRDDILKYADDYGFFAAGAETIEAARAKIEPRTTDIAPRLFSCKGTSNGLSGEYGSYSSEKNYKYVTFVVENIGDNAVAAKFYIKKDNYVYYANYTNNSYQTFNNCAVNWAALN